MRARCPNDPNHDQFVTVAHEQHDWLVDRHGRFLDDLGSTDVAAAPSPHNTWKCAVCDADAAVDP